uniref:rRNA adenine N(6)-methyltransferase n=1 Tax=Aegilops tauschii subsp. strangulata TaxID=200361 RepID=A0A453BEZ0_AEGTS
QHHGANRAKPDMNRAVSNSRARLAAFSASSSLASEAWDGRFRLHKPRGQHLLTNPRVLDAIARHAALRPGDAVLEVGPGTGNLTARLLASPADRVTAVEIDPRMVDAVTARFGALDLAHKLTCQVIQGDAMETEFPKFDVCVANIPYGISSPLIAKLLFGTYHFRTATLLLQKEFARRLVAMPGDSEYNRLAANVRMVADVKLLMDVSKRDFVPMPRVDSSLVEIQPRGAPPEVDLAEWLGFTRECFGQKNKTLGAIFKQKRKILDLLKRSQRSERCTSDAPGTGSGIILGVLDDDGNDEACSDEDGDSGDRAAGFSTEEVGAFKERIAGALESTDLAGKRPSKMSNDELLYLLRLFNERGIWFQ